MNLDYDSPPGLPGDSDAFKAFVEMDMISKAAVRAFERRLSDGLTQAQFGVLNRLARLGEPESVSELARAFDVAQPTMTSTLRRLSDKGMIDVENDPKDARRKLMVVNKVGLEARARAVTSILPELFGEDVESTAINWSELLAQLTALRKWMSAAGLTTFER